MVTTQLINFLNQYGFIFMFIIILIEYLNIPGFPAGIIYPAIGIWASKANMPFMTVFLISLVAGVIGSVTLFLLGRKSGPTIIDGLCNKNKHIGEKIREFEERLKTSSGLTVFICMFIPVIRTVIPLPAGVAKMDIKKYIIYSALGIAVWNGVLIYSGLSVGTII